MWIPGLYDVAIFCKVFVVLSIALNTAPLFLISSSSVFCRFVGWMDKNDNDDEHYYIVHNFVFYIVFVVKMSESHTSYIAIEQVKLITAKELVLFMPVRLV